MKVITILKALRIYLISFLESLIVESDSFNAISWVAGKDGEPRKFKFCLNEIQPFASYIKV